MSEQDQRFSEPLPEGTRVCLSRCFGTNVPFIVTASRKSHHGYWYTFRCEEFGDTASGYSDVIDKLLSLPGAA